MLPVSRVVPAVARATWTPTKALPARASSATMVRMRVLMPNSVLDTEDDEGMEPAAWPAGVDEARGASEVRDATILDELMTILLESGWSGHHLPSHGPSRYVMSSKRTGIVYEVG